MPQRFGSLAVRLLRYFSIAGRTYVVIASEGDNSPVQSDCSDHRVMRRRLLACRRVPLVVLIVGLSVFGFYCSSIGHRR